MTNANFKIDYYKNHKTRTASQNVTLTEIVSIIKNDLGIKEKLGTIQSIYRSAEFDDNEKTKQINNVKQKLPAVTFSGRFSQRNKNGLDQHSGLIVIDIDKLDSFETVSRLKETVFDTFPSVVMAFISPSQKGLKIVHQLDWNNGFNAYDQHESAFEQLSKQYQKYLDIKIDTSGKDVSRLCYLIHDSQVLYRDTGIVPFQINFESITSRKQLKENEFKSSSHIHSSVAVYLVEDILNYFRKNDLTITQPYENWMKVGFILKNELGENGRGYFHDFSKLDCEYDPKKVDEQFDNGADFIDHGLGLGSLIYLAKGQGYKPKKINKELHYELTIQSVTERLNQVGLSFRYNTLSGGIEYSNSENPWAKIDKRFFSKLYMNILKRDLRRDDLDDFLHVIAKDYDPVEHFLSSLPVNEIENDSIDYIKELANTLTTTNPEITYQALKVWLGGFIRCLKEDTYANELIPILIGKQGCGKTRWIERLIPDGWNHLYVSKNIDTNDKDDRKLVATNFWINMDELSTVLSAKSSTEAFKSFMSTKVHTVRLPYDKFETSLIRRASILGTSNDAEYLRDLTGNRRFISIECTDINVDHGIDMMRVYAQAYHEYLCDPKQAGVLIGKLAEKFADHNSSYKLSNPYEELFQKYFRPVRDDDTYLFRLTAQQMISIINHNERTSGMTSGNDAIAQSHTSQVGKILKAQQVQKSKVNRVKGVQGRYFDVALNTNYHTYTEVVKLGYTKIDREIISMDNALFDRDKPVVVELSEKESKKRDTQTKKQKKKERSIKDEQKRISLENQKSSLNDSSDIDELIEKI